MSSSESSTVARLTLQCEQERKRRLLAEEQIANAGKEIANKQQQQFNGRNKLLKKEESDYTVVNKANLGKYLPKKVLKHVKFLGAGWDKFSLEDTNTL